MNSSSLPSSMHTAVSNASDLPKRRGREKKKDISCTTKPATWPVLSTNPVLTSLAKLFTPNGISVAAALNERRNERLDIQIHPTAATTGPFITKQTTRTISDVRRCKLRKVTAGVTRKLPLWIQWKETFIYHTVRKPHNSDRHLHNNLPSRYR